MAIEKAQQKAFVAWLKQNKKFSDDIIGHLHIIGYIYFGGEVEIFHRTALELRGTLLKMDRDHDNGKNINMALQDNELSPPLPLAIDDFSVYIKSLGLYLEFLKISQSKESGWVL
ncbi:MAG: hypothetical protein ACR2NY_04940 [Alphaproteobacteria bacterium]